MGYRNPVVTLTYCGAGAAELCIESFTQQVDGTLQVNFLVPNDFYPDFLLKISHNGDESTYICEKVGDALTRVICSGASQVPGEVLQFQVFFKNGTTLAAQGSFTIIGIALMTPEVDSTATIAGTAATPSRTPTPTRTPLGFATRTPTPTPPIAYPNPTSYPNLTSYPNRSYP